jgi:hypothetical protein
MHNKVITALIIVGICVGIGMIVVLTQLPKMNQEYQISMLRNQIDAVFPRLDQSINRIEDTEVKEIERKKAGPFYHVNLQVKTPYQMEKLLSSMVARLLSIEDYNRVVRQKTLENNK